MNPYLKALLVMVTRTSDLMVGGGTATTGWLWSNEPYVCLQDTKTALIKRASPKGIDKLFNGTSVSYTKYRASKGVFTRVFTYTGEGQMPWSGYCRSVPIPVYPGRSASPPYGLTVTSNDWANQVRTKLMDLSVSVGMMFAEHKQTARLFEDFGQRIVKSYRALRKGNANGVYRALAGVSLPKGWKRGFTSGVSKDMSDAWLAWQYGIRPLVSDLAGSIDEYYKARGVRPLIRKVVVNVPERAVSDHGYVASTEPLSSFGKVSLRGRVVCYAEFESDANLYSTAQRLGLTNPALLLWEVIPWSFVIDWFLNVGEFLTAAASVPGLKRVGIHITSDYISTSATSQWDGSSKSNSQSRTRSFMNSLPGATLRFGSGPVSSWQRAVSSLALIRSSGSSQLLFPSRR